MPRGLPPVVSACPWTLRTLAMAATIQSSSSLVSLLQKHRSSSLPSPSVGGSDYASQDLTHSAFPDTQYSEHEKEEINSWLPTSQHIGSSSEDTAKASERLSTLNRHLSTRTTILGSKPSIADLAIYAQLVPIVSKWSNEERTGEQGYHHIVRHLLFVQASPKFGLELSESDRLNISEDDVVAPIKPIDPKVEKERKKREKEALAAAGESTAKENDSSRKAKKEGKRGTGEAIAAAVGTSVPLAQSSDGAAPNITNGTDAAAASADSPQADGQPKKQKKEKAPKPKKAPEAPKEISLTPALIDLRVGHILKAIQHPNADSLFVSTIAVGDPPGTENTSEYEGQVCRTVCSGLNGLVPLEEMQNRKIVAVCNLKPVTMRGIKSAAMVLAASPRLAEGEADNHAGPVELVEIPEGAKTGDRINFEGWEGEPEGVLNPKKKVWEMCQVGFTTTDSGEVAFESEAVERIKEEGKVVPLGKLVVKGGGVCKVKTLKGATVR